MVAVELVKDRESLARDGELRNAVVMRAFDKGLLILGCGPNSIRFAPALVLNEAEATVAAEIFIDVLNELS
jgi:4-aminobutyrate aminotransferase